MPINENQTVNSSRSQLFERMRTRFPDRDFSGAVNETGETSENVEALEQALLETLDAYQSEKDEYTSKNEALRNLMLSDPLASEFVNRWVQSGDPRAALVETFGDDLADLATEEGRGKFNDGLQDWRGRKAESDRLNAESDANWDASLEALDAWGNEKGLDNDQKVKVMLRLVGIAANGLLNMYTAEEFEMAYKEMNYDSALEAARRDGEVAGRNAKIDENKKRRQNIAAVPPSIHGGQGRNMMPPAPKKDDKYDFLDGVE